jgi:hypothetical protein
MDLKAEAMAIQSDMIHKRQGDQNATDAAKFIRQNWNLTSPLIEPMTFGRAGKKEEKVMTDPREIEGTEDTLNTLDIEERIQFLLGELVDTSAEDADEDYERELVKLLTFRDNVREDLNCASSWDNGLTLVRESHKQDYAKNYADECGYVSEPATWPHDCIDWEEAADTLFENYNSVGWEGYRHNVTYYFED